jgi:hypothetical protein
LTLRLCRCFDEGEFETRNAKGEGLSGGPPTGILSSLSSGPAAQLALLEDEREDRRSFGGGMGLGDDMDRESMSLSTCMPLTATNPLVVDRLQQPAVRRGQAVWAECRLRQDAGGGGGWTVALPDYLFILPQSARPLVSSSCNLVKDKKHSECTHGPKGEASVHAGAGVVLCGTAVAQERDTWPHQSAATIVWVDLELSSADRTPP